MNPNFHDMDDLDRQLKQLQPEEVQTPAEFKRQLAQRLATAGRTKRRKTVRQLAAASGFTAVLALLVAFFVFSLRGQSNIALEATPIITQQVEPIPGEPSVPTISIDGMWGTAERPITNPDLIRERVVAQQTALINELVAGGEWVYVRVEVTVPTELRPEGLIQTLFPDELMIHEQWIELSARGDVTRLASRYLDQAGVATQSSVVIGDEGYNLTLNQALSGGVAFDQLLPSAVLLQGLELAEANGRPVTAYEIEHEGQDAWQIIIEDSYGSNAPLDQLVGENRYAKGERITFVLSLPDVQPISRQVDLLLDDDSWLTAELTRHVAVEAATPTQPIIDLLGEAAQLMFGEHYPLDPSPPGQGSPPYDLAEADGVPMAETTRHGVTVQIIELDEGGLGPTIRLQLSASADWSLNPSAFPPEQILAYPSGSDSPDVIATTGTQGGSSWRAAAGGPFMSQSTLNLANIPAGTERIRTQTEIVLDGLFINIPLIIALDGRNVGETWAANQAISLGPAELPIEEIAWISQEDDVVELALRFGEFTLESADIQCLNLWDNSLNRMGCQNYEGAITVKLLLDPDAPSQTLPYWFKTSVAFSEPFVLEFDRP